MSPKVVRVEPLPDHRLRLFFDNGEVHLFDVSPYLDKGIFQELKSDGYFKQVNPFLGVCNGPMGKILGQIHCFWKAS